ncbi:hypothetical protein L7F22_047208 [Adiantum nelumboides]|nr:hypothetical protein [Adiantum nelumboides]
MTLASSPLSEEITVVTITGPIPHIFTLFLDLHSDSNGYQEDFFLYVDAGPMGDSLWVISHLPYGHKADVFSFGIVLWELLTGKLPYESMNPVQAAIGVRQGLRPQIPEQTFPEFSELIKRCWHDNPSERPDFCEISTVLQNLLSKVHV